MSHPRLKKHSRQRGVHKSTGGILHPIPSPVDPVDAAPKIDLQHSRSVVCLVAPATTSANGALANRARS